MMKTYNSSEFAQGVYEKLQENMKELKTLNIMVLGKTGVGKSTLINSVFNESLAKTGIGEPVTSEIKKYSKPDFPLAIYDSPGLELDGANSLDKLLEEVTEVIKNGLKSGDISKAIHCIWYCVAVPSHRFEIAEQEFITKLSKVIPNYQVPVIIVLTQACSKSETDILKSAIANKNLPVKQIVPVIAQTFDIGEYIVPAKGLEDLVRVVYYVIPEALQTTLIAVQRVSLDLKRVKAHAVVAAAATSAAATGAIPIPFSDAALLVPEQISMLASITAVFGLPIGKATLSTVVSSTIGTMGATVLGKTVVSSILKFIPGAGSIIGGVISGSIAASLTAALGEAYIAILSKIVLGEIRPEDLDTQAGKQAVNAIFKEKLSLKRDRKGNELTS